MPGLAKFMFTNYDYFDTGVGLAVDVVRRHYHVHHLHGSGWCIDFAYNTYLVPGIIRFTFITVSSIITAANIRLCFCFILIKGVTS